MDESNENVSSQEVITQDNIRRSANYKPNIWKYDFLQSLASKYDEEEYVMQLKKQVIDVKGLFGQEVGDLRKLELVDWIQKLGLANHFQKEINDLLESMFVYVKSGNNNPSTAQHIHVFALCFRLLRQQGYTVDPDILSSILDGNGEMIMRKSSCASQAKDVMELLEATHLGLEGEKILGEVKSCAINFLKKVCSPSSININKLSNSSVERMVHALELPSHWRVPWFEVKWHVKQYEKEIQIDPILLELAKLNFNMIQAKHQMEIKELSRWWENLGIKESLSFARNRLVESFMCAIGVAFETNYKLLRKWLTKVIIFVLVIDDVYDIHASFEELKSFTMAFERWDENDLEELPEFMRICIQALKDVTNEIAYEICGENNFDLVLVLPYLKKVWIDFCKALHVEAKWSNEGYIPSLQEYLSNAWISSSGPIILLHSYFATINQVRGAMIDDFLHTNEDLIYNVSLVIRLCNDLGTTMAERERGDNASSIVCYMHERDVSEEKARKHVQDIINKAWTKINGHYFTRVEPFLTQAMNAARVAHALYQNGDGFGIQDRDIKTHILSLVVESL